MSRSQVYVLLVVGAALGVVGTLVIPDLARRHLPESIVGSGPGVAGTVIDKERGSDQLLITIETPDGVVLVTFKRHVPEIDLLVQRGDRVTLDLGVYEPFVEDPKIRRVRKPEPETVGSSPDRLDTTSAPAAATGARDSLP